MIDNMYFIYSLLVDGQVFYIGKCKNLAARYSAHTSKALRKGHCDNAITARLREILAQGKCPIIKAIDYLPLKEALEREKELIQTFYAAGQRIANSNLIRIHMHIPEKFDFYHTPANIRKNARYQQKTTEHNYLRESRQLTIEHGSYPSLPKYKQSE